MHGNIPSKQTWKRIVWNKAWCLEKGQWDNLVAETQYLDLYNLVTEQKGYSVWWQMADRNQTYMRRCETRVKPLSHASLLKANDSKLRRATFSLKCCVLCDLASYEDAKHMVMQCPFHIAKRMRIYDEIRILYPDLEQEVDFEVLSTAVHPCGRTF